MKQRVNPRYLPKRPNYLRKPLLEKGAAGPRGAHHAFRIPDIATCARLAALLVDCSAAATADGLDLSAIEPGDSVGVKNARHVVASLETAGAVVGVCWWHPTWDLEVNEASSWREYGDIRDYGAVVSEELTEAGYSPAELSDFLSLLAGPIIAVIAPKKVDETVTFTEAPAEETTGAEANTEE